jgi:hypothetical protein
VADDEHGSAGVSRCDLAERLRDPGRVVLVRLTVPRASVDLRFRQPLPRADVDLAEPWILLDRKSEASADDLGRLSGAAQVARIDRVDRLCGEPIGQLLCLGPARLVQRRIRVTLVPLLAVPLGFAVACEEERRHWLYASRPWISGSAIASASSPARRAGSAALSPRCSPRRARRS